MNKHIELVKKWLADPTSVTQQELKDNRKAAYDAFADDTGNYADATTNAADADAYFAAYAAYAADAADAADASYWVRRYEELTK